MQGEVEATAGAPPVAQERPRAFGALWPFLRYAFIASIIVELLLALSTTHMYIFLDTALAGGEVTIEEGNFVDLHQTIFARLYLFTFVVSIVAYCRYYYRAMKNLTAVNAAGVETTPFWAVGYFFVPFANLWKPLGAVRQIWRGSFDPAAADAVVPGMIGWWWFCWLASNFLGHISFRMQASAGAFGAELTNLELYMSALALNIISAPFSIVGAIIVLKFSRRIKQAQDGNILQASFP